MFFKHHKIAQYMLLLFFFYHPAHDVYVDVWHYLLLPFIG